MRITKNYRGGGCSDYRVARTRIVDKTEVRHG